MKIKAIPREYGRIQDLFSVELEEASKRTGLVKGDLLAELERAKFLARFEARIPKLLELDGDVPIQLTSQEARRFLGISTRVWNSLLGVVTGEILPSEDLPWGNICPNLTRGSSVWDKRALFWGPDIGRIGTFLDKLYKGPRKARECPTIVEAFRESLVAFLAKLPDAPPITDVTVTRAPKPQAPLPPLPKDNTEVVAMYGADVAALVNRVCKIRSKAELDDVCQQMWIDLFKAQILNKFVLAAQTKLPRTMPLRDVVAYLGITSDQWLESKYARIPQPINAGPVCLDSLYKTDDVLVLEASDFLSGARLEPKQRPPVSGRGFKSYLMKAVHNHFKNYLRTKSRRHKERTVDPKNVFANDGAGVYHKVSTIEDGFSWEESLTKGDLSVEDMCDLVSNLKKHNIDPRSEHGIGVLDYMAQGYSIKDAIKAQNRASGRQKPVETVPPAA